MKSSAGKPIKYCLFVNVDWFVLSHFSHYLSGLKKKNIDVTVITLSTGRCNEIRSLGVKVIELELHRGYSNIHTELKSLFKIFGIIRHESPDVLELITIKAVVYGGLISKLLGIKKTIFYMSGLGAIFTDQSFLGRCKAAIVTNLYRLLMRSKSTAVIVENHDDKDTFRSVVGLSETQVHLIPGVGVDIDLFSPAKQRACGVLRVALISRLLYDKGVLEFVEAARLCTRGRPEVEFLLVGDTDPTNPASISQEDLDDISSSNEVQLLGHSKDVPSLMKTLDILVLPSYREGFPRVIMEAAATGIPVVTTDVTGCRSAVVHEQTGLIVPPKDVDALQQGIGTLLDSKLLRSTMGRNAREFAASNFDVNLLSKAHLSVWY